MASRALFLYGTVLDSLECEQYIARKRNDITSRLTGQIAAPNVRDPYDILTRSIKREFPDCDITFAGKVPIDDWLRPVPKADPMNLMMVTLTSYRTFNDSGGPEDYSRLVYESLHDPGKFEAGTTNNLNGILDLPDDTVPIMLGVDHSASGGAIQALSEKYGRDDLLLMVFDYHADIRPTHISMGLSQWDSERRRIPWYDTPRPDRYGAGSFLYYLFERQIVLPENTILVGPVAYPTRRLREVEDSRVQAYISLYDSLVERGLTIIHRHEFKDSQWRKRVSEFLKENKGSPMYLSFDTDVGILGPLNATRLIHFGPPEIPMRGLSQEELLDAADIVRKHIDTDRLSVVGMDFMEIDTLLVDQPINQYVGDRTTQFVNKFINTIL